MKYEKIMYHKIDIMEKKGEDLNDSEDENKLTYIDTIYYKLDCTDEHFHKRKISNDAYINTKNNFTDNTISNKEEAILKDKKFFDDIDNDVRILYAKINKAIDNMKTCDFNYKEIKELISEINDFYIVRYKLS